jgi:hypothetical protein
LSWVVFVARLTVSSNTQRGSKGIRRIVRGSIDLAFLRAQGIAITPQGHLMSLERFWHLSLEGGKAYPERIAASAASAGDAEEIDAGSSTLAECDVGDRTRSDAEEDDDLDYLFFEEIMDYEEQDMVYAEDN